MSYSFGKNLKVTCFGESHSEEIGVVIDGLKAGSCVDKKLVDKFLAKRKGLNNLSTARREPDKVKYVSGLVDEKTCGSPLTAIIENTDAKSSDYANLSLTPRPSHADYAATVKYQGNYDYRGGGQFSGRLTAPICVAGAIVTSLLIDKGIYIRSVIKSVKDVTERAIDLAKITKEDFDGVDEFFPTFDKKIAKGMQIEILKAKKSGDSVGGTVECFIFGLPVGVGEPNFDSIESRISSLMFSIPSVKGVEFGNGFLATKLYGSENNDEFYYDNGKVKTKSNNSGGINGGISNGMAVAFTVAIKPTPSIYKEQQTVNLAEKSNETLIIKGRHDPCIVPRAVAVIESMAALAVYDLLIEEERRNYGN